MNNKSYLIINWIFVGIILSVFLYSMIYKPEKNSHPIKCMHEELLGSKCPSCGMSRGFSSIVRGNFDQAIKFQKNSIPVFLFFLFQLGMRLIFIWSSKSQKFALRNTISLDVTLSTVLFFLCFKNLIFQTLYIFYKMLLTGNIA